MKFNFKEILEMFSGHWRFLTLLVLVAALVSSFVIVPLAESWFNSDKKNCSEVLDENEKLITRLVEISAIMREYSKAREVQERMNKSVSEMIVERTEEEDTVSIKTIQVVDKANEQINRETEKLIEKATRLTELD